MRQLVFVMSAILLASASKELTAQGTSSAVTTAQSLPSRVRVVVGSARILRRPSLDGTLVTVAGSGTVLDVVDGNGQWYWVSLPPQPDGTRRRGWIQAQDVQQVASDPNRIVIPPTGDEIRRREAARREAEERRIDDAAAARRREATAKANQPPMTTQSVKTATDSNEIGIRAFGLVDTNSLLAQDSFDAVLGTSRLTAFGGGADVLNVWKSAFVRVAASRSRNTGNRAFAFNGQVVSLNIPIAVSTLPVEIGGGWRVTSSRLPHAVPYVGAGALVQHYSEKSTFAGPGDDVSQTNIGFSGFGGVEVDVWRKLIVGGEVQVRRIPNAIGQTSVSQDFGETNLGGFSVRALIGFRY